MILSLALVKGLLLLLLFNANLDVPGTITYLDRNGEKIGVHPYPGPNKTFIVRTTCSTDELYDTAANKVHHKMRGRSNPITPEEAQKTEQLILAKEYEKAMKTGNLVQLRPLAERKKDVAFFYQDDGSGKDSINDGREYVTIVHRNGWREEKRGEVSDPSKTGAACYVPEGAAMYSHSHPSRVVTKGNIEYSFYPQAPSSDDIHTLKAGEIRVVFGRATDKVYLYNSTGVIAVLPTKNYSQ